MNGYFDCYGHRPISQWYKKCIGFLPPPFFRATPTAYGSSQARGQNPSCSHQPIPQPQ